MSGLNPITRAILRVADRIAGPQRSDWTAAMAAETDAAESRGVPWALGALLSAIGLHWRDNPGRTLFLFLSPLVMFVLIFVAMWPIAVLQQAIEVPPVVFFFPMVAVQAFMGYLIAKGSPAGFPFAGLTYFMMTMVVVPALIFANLTQTKSNIVWGENASWFGLAPILGIAISYAAVILGARLGYARRATSLR